MAYPNQVQFMLPARHGSSAGISTARALSCDFCYPVSTALNTICSSAKHASCCALSVPTMPIKHSFTSSPRTEPPPPAAAPAGARTPCNKHKWLSANGVQ
jgi:hypothetical protein